MDALRRFGGPLCILILLFALQSCASTKNGPSPQTAPQGTPEATGLSPQETPPPRPGPAALAPKPVKPPAANGDYQKMIDFYKKERRHRPHDQALAKEYAKSLKEMKTAADRASQNEDFAHAGKTYSLLLKNYPYFKDLAQDLSFDRDQLNNKVTNCKTILYNKGFQEYRAGNLNEAISLWQGYLTIDPRNPDIRKALNTARTQQKNLQQSK
jgi:tetratricopeptide (TPR) repeat protein